MFFIEWKNIFFMAFTTWGILAVISRFFVAVFCFFLMRFFFLRYKKSKAESQSPNYYYSGLTLFYGSVGIVLLFIGFQDLLQYAEILFINLETAFPDYDLAVMRGSYGWLSELLANLIRPIYLFLFIYAMIIFAIQIYPLEKFLHRKNFELWILGIAIILCATIYIPPLYLTIYAFMVLLYVIFALLLAFLVNLYLTGKIIKESVGIVRKRAFMNAVGFFLFLIGLIYSMRVGWTKVLLPGVPLDADVFFGDMVVLIAAIIYWRAFRTD